MDINYNHNIIEKDKNKKWIEKKFFIKNDLNKKPFSIILPPPNVTGKLHLGHAWDSYIQDTIIRYKKLQDYDVLFVPGTDHAGIATQAKVEQKLREMNINKYEIGREEFIKWAYQWKDEYSSHIHEQWNKLGLALNYDCEKFTLDPTSNDAVNKVFIELYNKGLIYRGKRAICWDPILETAVSNIEIINQKTNSKMYYIKYFLEDNSKDFIVIATTRIETLFSDVAIAINPNDQTKKHLLGKFVINPITNKKLPIIADEHIDIEFGTGFMKVSAHAMDDIEIINKNNLEIIECIDKKGMMNDNALSFKGLSREEAREKVFEFLKNNNFIDKVEDIINNVSYSERSNAVIEILVMPQWFVKMDKFSQLVLDNLKTKNKVQIFPKRFEEVLKKWMNDAYDWTISRQLWWGHQIPAWYKGDQIKVQIESPGNGWTRDEDVLDTWFSSGLAPLSFLDWPNESEKLKRYFPVSLMVTGYDIIFFWVARMYFFSLYFQNQIPFKNLLIHGLIRDENGRKMSKSLGNGIDPMEVIDNYGSDSLRWYLLTNSSPGLDINFSIEKLKSAWSLCNKIWSISRYIKQMPTNSNKNHSIADIWIVNSLLKLKKSIDQKIDKYEFTIIGKEITDFIYNDFSSWYIEFSKVNKNKDVCLKVLKNLLILIHPFLPFLTDHLYLEIFNEELLENEFDLKSIGQENKIQTVIDAVSLRREARNIYNISNKEIVNYQIVNINDKEIIELVNKVANANFKENKDALFTIKDLLVNIELSETIKMQEKIKTQELLKKINAEIQRSENILSNANFLNKAPKEKIEEEKNKYENYKKQLMEIERKLKKL